METCAPLGHVTSTGQPPGAEQLILCCFFLFILVEGKAGKTLTFDGQGQRVALALSFHVGGQTGVKAGRLAIDALQNQTLVAHYDTGTAVLVQYFALFISFA